MSVAIVYRGQFVNQETSTTFNENEQQLITIDIEDLESGEADESVIIPLELSETPLRISIVNNDEKKFTVLRPKQAEISINTSDSIGIETFCEGGDNRFKVRIYSQVETLLLGFLSISDLEEQFQPDPNVLLLTAFDGLGFLEAEQLNDFDGNVPSSENRIIDYLVWLFAKTGLSLHIKAVMNYRERYATPLLKDNQAPLTTDAVFFGPGSGNKVRVVNTVDWFYIGQKFTTVDAGGNTGPFTVIDIQPFGSDIDVFVTEEMTPFIATLAPAVFTDISPEGHLFNSIYLDAKTFEGSDIGTTLYSDECLKRIFGATCFVEQKNGEWWIVNPDEMRVGNVYYITEFDEEGNWVANSTAEMVKQIGVSSPMQWMNDDAIVITERPSKKAELTYKYEYPKELPCNKEFERGEVINAPDLSAENSTGTYELECWVMRRLADQTITSEAWIEREFEYGYEKSRYIVITPADDAATPWDFIESTPINVQEGDKVTVSVDFRFASNYGNGEGAARYFPMRVYAYDENGKWWHWFNASLNPDEYFWDGPYDVQDEKSIPASWNLDATDESEWQNVSAEMDAVPFNGKLYIGLNQMHQGEDSGDNQEVFYQNLAVQYTPRINNSYAKYTGQRITISQETDPDKYKQVLEEQVYLSDAPNKNIKGALLKKGESQEIFSGEVSFLETPGRISISGDWRSTFREGMVIIISGSASNNIETRIIDVNYIFSAGPEITTLLLSDEVTAESGVEVSIKLVIFVLANRFYDAQAFPNAEFPDETYVHPYGHLQAFGYWNQYNRVMRKFEGAIDRTQSGSEMPDMVHKFQLTDPHINTNNKIFMLLHYEMDVHLCQWDGFFHEVEDSVKGKVYTGNEFKYITDE